LTEKQKKITDEYVGREKFIELVREVSKKFIDDYKNVWNCVGMSCDWSLAYQTIDSRIQKMSQLSFLELLKQKRVERKESPIIWCPKCKTAIAQVEMEDKQFSSHLCYIEFETDVGEKLTIATTRPELMPACVGVSVHPDDERYKKFIGKKAKLPMFDRWVPILADEETKPEFGTGVVYYCTYGGSECVEWMVRHPEVKPIPIMGKDGKFFKEAGKYAGLKSLEARKQIIADLEASGAIVKKEQISHAVNVHERCGTQIEYIMTKQWFIKYLDLKKEFLKRGGEIAWHPKHMKVRLDNWINGLKWDWCISRQRFYGVPFPVWYCKKCGDAIFASEEQLPVDPLVDKPKNKCKCDAGVVPEKDILDTWMTSSMTPLINARWKEKDSLMDKIYPMDLRPQAHDIITFWAFNTIVKGHFHTDSIPFKTIMISGHGLDKKGKKMSKSKGNVVDPLKMIDKYSSDAVRYWAGSAKLGEDLAFQEDDLKNGQKLITKLWNASKFVQMNLMDESSNDDFCLPAKPAELGVIDKWILAKFNKLIARVTEGFEIYEYSRAKNETEHFFWKFFCDNYLEMVKHRMYDQKDPAARWTAYQVLIGVLKLFAPIIPHITDELYQKMGGEGSIHISEWPTVDKEYLEAEVIGDLARVIVSAVRQWKHSQKLSLNAPINELVIECSKDEEAKLAQVLDDIKGTMKISEVKFGSATQAITDSEIRIDVRI
jgi:valyl-tRNA synthetase